MNTWQEALVTLAKERGFTVTTQTFEEMYLANLTKGERFVHDHRAMITNLKALTIVVGFVTICVTLLLGVLTSFNLPQVHEFALKYQISLVFITITATLFAVNTSFKKPPEVLSITPTVFIAQTIREDLKGVTEQVKQLMNSFVWQPTTDSYLYLTVEIKNFRHINYVTIWDLYSGEDGVVTLLLQ